MEFSFTSSDYNESLEQIAVWLGNKAKDNTVSFDEYIGRGTANIALVEPGLFVRVWDYVLKDDLTFRMLPSPINHPPNLVANYILTPAGYYFPSFENNKIQRTTNNPALLLLTNSQNDLRYNIAAGIPVKSFEICITTGWLAAQMLNNDSKKAERLVLDKTREPQLTNYISINDYTIVEELQHKIFDGNTDKIYVRSRLLLLINSLLQQYFLGEKTESPLMNRYAPGLAKVEQYVSSLIQGKLPDVDELAKKFSISQSTLKRQFRALYGKNIYQYYLEKKMDLARQLLKEGNLTVSEIAFRLGYEKVSSFSSIFKKHFGKTPAAFSEEHNPARR